MWSNSVSHTHATPTSGLYKVGRHNPGCSSIYSAYRSGLDQSPHSDQCPVICVYVSEPHSNSFKIQVIHFRLAASMHPELMLRLDEGRGDSISFLIYYQLWKARVLLSRSGHCCFQTCGLTLANGKSGQAAGRCEATAWKWTVLWACMRLPIIVLNVAPKLREVACGVYTCSLYQTRTHA